MLEYLIRLVCAFFVAIFFFVALGLLRLLPGGLIDFPSALVVGMVLSTLFWKFAPEKLEYSFTLILDTLWALIFLGLKSKFAVCATIGYSLLIVGMIGGFVMNVAMKKLK